MKISAVIRLATVCVVLLAGYRVCLVINWEQAIQRSGPAEWLSALLNLVMAGAAVAAYLTARSWLPQLTTQEGYKLAIHLVNNELIWLGVRNRLSSDAGIVFEIAREAFNGGNISPATQGHLEQAIARLERTTKESRRRKDDINDAIFRMKTYGLLVAKDREAHMSEMLHYHENSIGFAKKLLATIRDYHDLRRQFVSQDVSFFRQERDTRLNKLKEDDATMLASAEVALRGVCQHGVMMKDAYAAFNAGDHRIGKLFIVRRG
ncbi:DUF3450 domain-containing protein (plasmid) [Kosakonia radicincitans]|uniref:DUF3450 domain-containing protein n=1 Tax=Kosakonia radicincitans TaxID=283686 RepID=UPI0011F0145E|nr:DUF3450 domain-containing protein [Kosakonia radicincitans]QEM94353.1 DUF3450 domain-containing protein [Kosakonia radicincitans]